MRDTAHFGEADQMMVCPCCRRGNPTVALLLVLEYIRYKFGQPVTITSGGRCAKHNKEVGGARNSYHVIDAEGNFKAVDFKVKGVSPDRVYQYLANEAPFKNLIGVGKYNGRTHVDVRGWIARWDTTK